MDMTRAALVVGITLVAVLLVNIAIYLAVIRRNAAKDKTVGQIELLRRAATRAQDPWKPEDDALKELARRVQGLQDGKNKPVNQDENR